MQHLVVQWFNLTGKAGKPLLCERLEKHCQVRHSDDALSYTQLLKRTKPDIICLDFAAPDHDDRALVQQIKLEHPSIPLLMFTTSHSAELMIWALRTRVWDCFIKPVSCGEVMRRLNILLPVLGKACDRDRRQPLMPERNAFSDASELQGEHDIRRTASALAFLKTHFHEKIALPDAARLCSMDTFEFSRCFRREQGITFRDYLIRLRIETAARHLRKDDRSVLDIAYSVGFNDPSHFARLFRRHMGITPRAYRNATESQLQANGRECAAS